MKGLFLDAVDDLASVFRHVSRPGDPPMTVHEHADIKPEAAVEAGIEAPVDLGIEVGPPPGGLIGRWALGDEHTGGETVPDRIDEPLEAGVKRRLTTRQANLPKPNAHRSSRHRLDLVRRQPGRPRPDEVRRQIRRHAAAPGDQEWPPGHR